MPFVQSTSGASGNNTSHDQAFASAMTEGNLVVVQSGSSVDSLVMNAPTLRNVANTADVLTLTRLYNNPGTVDVPLGIWWGIVPAGTGTVVRYTNTTNAVKHVDQMEFSGNSTVAGVDDDKTTGAADGEEQTVNQVTATASDSGAGITTSVPDTILIGCLQVNGNVTNIAGTLGGVAADGIVTTARSAMFYRIVSATGTYDATATWTTTQTWSQICAAFELLAGAAAVPLPPGKVVEPNPGWMAY